MIAIAAHIEHEARTVIARALRDAGWTVHLAADADAAEAACRDHRADVLMAGEDVAGGVGALLDRIKRDPDLFLVPVVVVGGAPGTTTVLDWLDRGADDVLRTPADPADVVSRAYAAARTKALVEELTARNDRLEELVLFDELTGLRNRRAILQELDMLLAGAERHGHELAVLMLDVDRFKTINDERGHAAGDEVLRAVARRIEGRLRTADVPGRLGGDELLVALPDTGAEGARTLAESIRAAVAEGPVRTSAGPIAVTVSVGAAAWAGEDFDRLLERADQALYAAKAAGRDASVVAS